MTIFQDVLITMQTVQRGLAEGSVIKTLVICMYTARKAATCALMAAKVEKKIIKKYLLMPMDPSDN